MVRFCLCIASELGDGFVKLDQIMRGLRCQSQYHCIILD